MDATATATPEPVETEPVEIAPAESIADHAAQYGPEAVSASDDPEVEPAKPPHPSTQQRRDRQNGQWNGGKVRHRAKSDQAGPGDAEVIGELTGRLHALVGEHGKDIARKEGESDRAYKLRQRVEVMERLAKPVQQAPPPVQQPQPPIHQAPPPQGGYQGDPEPQESDPRYESNYGLFLRDQAAWVSREQIRQFHAYQQQQAWAHRQAQSWREKVDKVKTKYPDFEAVAFNPQRPPRWPEGSVPDQFIRQHDNGAELLYYLQSNPAEVDALAQESVLKQAERLTLILQRFASSPSAATGTNGAAPGHRQLDLPPKPPTPLRTEVQRATPTAPPTDGTLSIDEHKRAWGRKKK